MKYLFAFCVAVALTAAPAQFSRASESSQAMKPLAPGQATVWYLGHCGYAVRTSNHFLIFDYIELEEEPAERGLEKGFIDPEEIKDLNVSVFVTHNHIDHFDDIILRWEAVVDTIRYFFGWRMEEKKNHYMLEGPRAALKFDDMDIFTVNSNHAGVPEVGYYVIVDSLKLFHAGDYQGIMERGGPSHANEDMRFLISKAPAPDLLFIGAWTGEPYLKVIKELDPKIIFSMHYRKQEEKYKQFAKDLKALGITQPVICPEKRGDRYRYRNGAIE
jgi:L-ascorbate metabolism protein UlaG (beta-lactamase superfamily)